MIGQAVFPTAYADSKNPLLQAVIGIPNILIVQLLFLNITARIYKTLFFGGVFITSFVHYASWYPGDPAAGLEEPARENAGSVYG